MDKATIKIDNLTFEVRIIDTKRSYGHALALITPVSGSGEKWVRVENLKGVTK